MRSGRDLDEDDIRVRPGRNKSRPRSKERPSHTEGEPARVVAVDRGRFTCLIGTSAVHRYVFAVKAREVGRKAVVVGDEVWLTGDTGGGPDNLARIVRVLPRRTALMRSPDDSDMVERVLVANAEQLAIVVALADPSPSTGLIDRCLVAGYDAGLRPLLVLTKADLADPAELAGDYLALDIPTIASGQSGSADELEEPALQQLREALRDRLTVLVGHSGVGKSTLVNALIPDADRAIGHVNEVTGRGRHTSTQAVAMPLPEGGWIIDTPGVRSFGLGHVSPARVVESFPEFHEAAAEHCPRGCDHLFAHAGCELDVFVTGGGGGPAGVARLASLRRLLTNSLAN
ncbi:MAG: ribosome small subunit-dependent GTPase A [Candidatus Nanopelagicales bacterium]